MRADTVIRLRVKILLRYVTAIGYIKLNNACSGPTMKGRARLKADNTVTFPTPPS